MREWPARTLLLRLSLAPLTVLDFLLLEILGLLGDHALAEDGLDEAELELVLLDLLVEIVVELEVALAVLRLQIHHHVAHFYFVLLHSPSAFFHHLHRAAKGLEHEMVWRKAVCLLVDDD